jgi:transposase
MPREIWPNASDEEITLMESILAKGEVAHKYAVRIQTVLNRARGLSTNDVALFLSIDPVTVSRYVRRFNDGGVNALLRDKSRKPGKQPVSEEVKNEITRVVCQEKPVDATHWSTRELAKRFGIGHATVNNILRERGLKPHLVKRFQASSDPDFDAKLKDVIGLYLDPPENAIVLCVDEKSQIQALERSQPILPLLPGVPERQTHDYYRHGTTTLFAALNVVSGRVIGECKPTHRANDYVEFLKLLQKKTPKKKVIHIVADNYSAHKAPAVREYLDSKPGRFVEHFIPTHSSWLNMVERWFAEITTKRIRRESWNSVQELERSITEYIKHWNDSGKCFTWTKGYDEVKRKTAKAAKI